MPICSMQYAAQSRNGTLQLVVGMVNRSGTELGLKIFGSYVPSRLKVRATYGQTVTRPVCTPSRSISYHYSMNPRHGRLCACGHA